MFQSIWDDIKREFQSGNMLTRIIIVNIAFWAAMILAKVFLGEAYNSFSHYLMLSSGWENFLFRPWTWFTHMFLHEGLWHILFNMLILYWFGKIVGDFIGDYRVLPLYLIGGLAGAVFYFLGVNLVSPNEVHYALGASAAATCFITAAATLSPNYEMRLLLLGNIKIKYIALFVLLFDFAGIASNYNTGGHFGHLGGYLMGIIYVLALRNGEDLATPFNSLFNKTKTVVSDRKRTPTPARKVYVRHRSYGHKQEQLKDYHGMSHQEKLDAILEKIKESGYDNLSDDEKDFLFEASKKS